MIVEPFQQFEKTGGHLPLMALVLANLVPLYGVFFAGWDAGLLIVLYWAENLVIGGYHVLKMLLIPVSNPVHLLGSLFTILFFTVHYGGFVAVHGMFVFQLAGLGEGDLDPGGGHWPGPLVFVGLLVNVVQYMFSHMTQAMWVALVGLVVSHGISFIWYYLFRGERRQVNPRKMMSQPYGRIMILHVTILAGAFLVIQSGSSVPMLLVLVGVKMLVDIKMHLRSHKRLHKDIHNGLQEHDLQDPALQENDSDADKSVTRTP
jgi:hypothetical protein